MNLPPCLAACLPDAILRTFVAGSSALPAGEPNFSLPRIEKKNGLATPLSGYCPGPGPPASGACVARGALPNKPTFVARGDR